MRMPTALTTLILTTAACLAPVAAVEVPRHENNNACRFDLPTRTENGRIVCDDCDDLPGFVKKHGTIGSQADLPEGFVAWVDDGLWVSPTQAFKPTRVPNAADANAVRISNDGRWLLIRSGNGPLRISKLDGSVSVAVPMEQQRYDQYNFGWVRNGPKGDEVFWHDRKKDNNAYALEVDLSGAEPSFGDRRMLSEGITWDQNWNQSLWVSGDHMYNNVRIKVGNRNSVRTMHGVIPDNGLGTATDDDLWTYGNEAMSYFECGPAMSWSGELIAYNPAGNRGTWGGVAWERAIPGFGKHSGPAVAPFMEQGSAPDKSGIGDYLLTTDGVSLNWAPYPLYNHIHDFHVWNFSNQDDYIVCRLLDEREKVRHGPDYNGPVINGVWVLHHPSNTWTPVTAFDVESSDHALYFGNLHAIGFPAGWRGGGETVRMP